MLCFDFPLDSARGAFQTSAWFALTFCGLLPYLTGAMAPYASAMTIGRARACLCSMAPLSGSRTGTAFV